MNKFILRLMPIAGAVLLTMGCGGGSSKKATVPSSSSVASSTTTSQSTSAVVSSSSVVTSSSLPSSSLSSSSSSSQSSFSGYTYQAEDQFISGGVTKSDTYIGGFTSVGARAIFTINVESAGNYGLKITYANGASDKTLGVLVNGLASGSVTLSPSGGVTTWEQKIASVNLRAGLNTISLKYESGNNGDLRIDSIELESGMGLASRGATLPYQEYEAENGDTNGQVSAAGTTYLSVESESSGRKFVNLSATGNYVEWVASKAANSLVVRYNMPDAAGGGGTSGTLSLYIDGVKVKSLDLSSRYAWVYGNYPYNDNPANGNGHHFYDESRFSGLTIPAGAKVRLQKDAEDSASYYKIDLIDLELADAPYTMPSNFLDITAYGAVANDNVDDTSAVVTAIAAAKAANKGVWIPEGKFILSGRPDINNVHIRGAGMWYTTLQGTNGKGGFRGNGGNVTVADLTLVSDSIVRNDAADNPAFEGDFGSGSLIQNIWVEHMKVGLWLAANTNGLYIVNGRIRDTWADGLNFAGGVKNSTISHFNIRNTGDDSLAMWSNGSANINNSFRFNYAQLPALANAFAIYGGQDNKILDNIGSDTVVSAAGIAISSRFSPTSFGGTTEVRRNTLNRTGGYDYGWNTTFGAVWIFADGGSISAPIVIDNLEINNSTYDAILMSYNQLISNLTVNNVKINGAGGYGINVGGITGTGNFSNVIISGASSGAISNSSYTIVKGDGNVGW